MVIGIASRLALRMFKDFFPEELASRIQSLNSSIAPAPSLLAIEFLRLGHKLVIFTQDESVLGKVEVLKGKNITAYVAPVIKKKLHLPYSVTLVSEIRSMFRMHTEPIDVVSAHWTRDYAIAANYFVKKDIPVFVTIRDIIPYIIKQTPFKNMLTWGLIYLKNEWVMRQRCFHFIANSAYTAKMVKHYWNLDVPIIPNSVSSDFLDNFPRKVSSDTFIISSISVSDISNRRKNIMTLLKAFQIVRKDIPDAKLNLIGPNFRADAAGIMKIRQDGLLEGVNLCGKVSHSQIREMMLMSDVMVHPSLEETFGNTLVEAMACHCPVVGGKDSGAVPYVLDNGRAGFLCDVTDSTAIAKIIKFIYNNPNDVAEKVKYARKYCLNVFSLQSSANAYLKLFRKQLCENESK